MQDKNKRGLILSILGVLSATLVTAGITLSFFNYAGEGVTDNIITTGNLTFLYTENPDVGKGITIENAFPMEDDKGAVLMGEGEYFDFKVTSTTTGTSAISYEVTARKSEDSDDIDEYIRLYLTSGVDVALLENYSELPQTSKVSADKYTEKTIYTEEIPENTFDYEQTFRLRMWLNDQARFENEAMNNKKFTLIINVYANGRVITQEEIDYKNSTEITHYQ